MMIIKGYNNYIYVTKSTGVDTFFYVQLSKLRTTTVLNIFKSNDDRQRDYLVLTNDPLFKNYPCFIEEIKNIELLKDNKLHNLKYIENVYVFKTPDL